MTHEKPRLDFAEPAYSYDELEAQLKAHMPKPEKYVHDIPSMISIEEAIRTGRLGNVAVGGCLMKEGKVILRDGNKANSPYLRSDLHSEMVLLNALEDQLRDKPAARMRDYTLFTSQEACPMCLTRICFSQVGKTYYVYRDRSSPEAGEVSNWDRLPPGIQGLGSRLVFAEAQCAPELKEISRQVWLNSIGPAINEILERY